MDVFRIIIQALWHQDFSALANPDIILVIYAVLFTTLFLENGFLPAAFLPGDSLLLLSGALIAKGVISLTVTLFILSIAAALGCWLSYLQGRWLGHTQLVKKWLLYLPAQYHQRANNLFSQHGLAALLVSRFLGFVRTLLPIIAGISGLKRTYFQLFNWMSATIWVNLLVNLGYLFSQAPWIKRYESIVMTGLIILPLILLMLGLLGTIIVILRSKKIGTSS